MSRPYSLRPVQAEDEPLLFEIYASTRTEEMDLLAWDESQKEAFLRMQFAAQHQHYRKAFAEGRFDIVLSGERPIGRLYVARGPDEIRIVDIALLPEGRNQGIGSSLLKEILAEAREAGKPVRIHVERNNPALRLYERLGFSRIGDTGVYFLMEWVPEPPAPE